MGKTARKTDAAPSPVERQIGEQNDPTALLAQRRDEHQADVTARHQAPTSQRGCFRSVAPAQHAPSGNRDDLRDADLDPVQASSVVDQLRADNQRLTASESELAAHLDEARAELWACRAQAEELEYTQGVQRMESESRHRRQAEELAQLHAELRDARRTQEANREQQAQTERLLAELRAQVEQPECAQEASRERHAETERRPAAATEDCDPSKNARRILDFVTEIQHQTEACNAAAASQHRECEARVGASVSGGSERGRSPGSLVERRIVDMEAREADVETRNKAWEAEVVRLEARLEASVADAASLKSLVDLAVVGSREEAQSATRSVDSGGTSAERADPAQSEQSGRPHACSNIGVKTQDVNTRAGQASTNDAKDTESYFIGTVTADADGSSVSAALTTPRRQRIGPSPPCSSPVPPLRLQERLPDARSVAQPSAVDKYNQLAMDMRRSSTAVRTRPTPTRVVPAREHSPVVGSTRRSLAIGHELSLVGGSPRSLAVPASRSSAGADAARRSPVVTREDTLLGCLAPRSLTSGGESSAMGGSPLRTFACARETSALADSSWRSLASTRESAAVVEPPRLSEGPAHDGSPVEMATQRASPPSEGAQRRRQHAI